MERTGDFGLNWDESGARMYDPQLGRFHGVDLLAGVFPGITPMQFGANSPVVLNDPSGLCPDCKTWGDVAGSRQRHDRGRGLHQERGRQQLHPQRGQADRGDL